MLTKLFKKEMPLFQSIAVMVGTIIGAGILGLPYVFMKAGFWTGALLLGILTFAIVVMKLMFGEVTLRTYGKHQLSGYVEKYLGKFWQDFTSVILVISISGSLLAYFVGVGEVLVAVFSGSAVIWALLFYIVAATFLYYGIQLIKRTEFILSIIIFFIILVIIILSIDHFEFAYLSNFNLSNIFVPYGVILFALSGLVAVPEVREILFRREYMFKKAILLGALIPSVIYFIFAAVVVSVSGPATTEVATIGLGQIMGPKIELIGNLFAFFAMATSFLTIGLALKEVYHYDFRIRHFRAWLLTVIVPLIIYFLGIQDFISIMAIVGAFGFGVNSIIYIITFWQARYHGRRQPEYVIPTWFAMPISIFLIAVFVGGLVYTLYGFF